MDKDIFKLNYLFCNLLSLFLKIKNNTFFAKNGLYKTY